MDNRSERKSEILSVLLKHRGEPVHLEDYRTFFLFDATLGE